ncbi:1936_t:CDS:2, partial [Gigaspora rosea]
LVLNIEAPLSNVQVLDLTSILNWYFWALPTPNTHYELQWLISWFGLGGLKVLSYSHHQI